MRCAAFTTAPLLLLLFAGALGCDTGTEQLGTEPAEEQPETAAVEEDAAFEEEAASPGADAHAIRGTVTAVDREAPAVTLDHEEIEGFMKAMTMEFPVENRQLLEGIEEGEQVQGRLLKRDGKYVITEISEAEE